MQRTGNDRLNFETVLKQRFSLGRVPVDLPPFGQQKRGRIGATPVHSTRPEVLMKTQALTLLTALVLVGCSSKFDDEGGADAPPSLGGDADADGDGDGDADADADADADGSPDPEYADADGDGVSIADGDCNDEDDDIYPRFDGRNGAEEVCDGIDNDCDDVIDEGFAKDLYFPDEDGDEYGDADDDGIEACEDAAPGDYVLDNTDCDDNEETVYPGAEEIIGDDMDNDCDGQAEERFDFTAVDLEGNLGNPSVIRLDGAGRTHVVFHDSEAGEVLYLQISASGEVADEAVLVSDEAFDGAYLDAEIDVTDTLHIAYTSDVDYGDVMIRSLHYIKRSSSGIWSEPQTIDGGMSGQLERGQYVDISIHNSPWLGTTPSFAYLDGDNGTPTLADVLVEGMEPIRFTVGTNYMSGITAMDSGLYTAMDVDTEGRQHVAFFDPNASFGTAAQIQYTTFEWDEDILETGDFMDLLPSYGHFEETVLEADAANISLDTRQDDNVACIAYQDTGARDLMFTCRDAEGWAAPTNVHSVGLTGAEPSLKINSAGDYFISFYDEGTQDLMLASKRKEMEWEVIEVETEGMVGKASSLDIGPDGRLHISYYDQSNQSVRIASGY